VNLNTIPSVRFDGCSLFFLFIRLNTCLSRFPVVSTTVGSRAINKLQWDRKEADGQLWAEDDGRLYVYDIGDMRCRANQRDGYAKDGGVHVGNSQANGVAEHDQRETL